MKTVLPVILLIFCVFATDVDYDLKRGWNLISVPGTPDATSLDELFPFISPAYGYNPETMAYTEIADLPPINAGFWMLVESDTLITLSLSSDFVVDSGGVGFYGLLEPGTKESTMVAVEIEGGFAFLSAVIVETPTGGEDSKLAFIKTDVEGNPLMANNYGLSTGGAMLSLDGGDFLIAGRLNTWSSDIFYGKIDGMGNPEWFFSFSSTMAAENMEIVLSTGGDYLFVLGSIMISTDSDGEINLSNALNQTAIGVFPEVDGGYYVVTRISGEDTGFEIAEYTASWDFVEGYSMGSDLLEEYQLSERREDGGFVICGVTYSGTRGKASVISISPELRIEWAKTLDAGDVSCNITDILLMDSGDIILVGVLDGDQLLLSLNGDGELNWAETQGIPGPADKESGLSIHRRDEGFIVFGWKDFWEEHNHTTVTFADIYGNSCLGGSVYIDIVDYVIESSPSSDGISEYELLPEEVTVETEAFEMNRSHICR